MLKKVLAYIGWSLLVVALGAYFFFAAKLRREAKEKEVCRSITVTLLDSAQNRFVSKNEVVDIIEDFIGEPIGKKIEEINLANIELLLNKRSAIKESQASISRNGVLAIDITQRKPLLRIHTQNGGFYVDETGYIFPLVESFSSYVPIVTGHIPLDIDPSHRGNVEDGAGSWIEQLVEFGCFLNRNQFWNAMIEQIYVEKNGDIILSPKVGNMEIIIGQMNNLEDKFSRLLAFYKNIAPSQGWNKYSTVNLKYKDQIVCKLNKKNKAKTI
ncbi:MAG: hypothetical protein IIW25_00145 [Bacteroidales bacterium]|nr:hypothetical protein [Bacteroidales bacterium]